MAVKINATDSGKFQELVNSLIQFFEAGLKLDKNPPKDVLEFYKILVELERAVRSVKSPKEFDEFLVKYSDDIELLRDFTADMRETSKT